MAVLNDIDQDCLRSGGQWQITSWRRKADKGDIDFSGARWSAGFEHAEQVPTKNSYAVIPKLSLPRLEIWGHRMKFQTKRFPPNPART